MNQYFNYFTEIEEHFQRRRGTGLLLSSLDWALIETWKDAGIPLAAVLRGIDETFDRYDQRKSKSRKVNSLAYCSQAVLTAAEDLSQAATGVELHATAPSGLEPPAIAAYLRRHAAEVGTRAEMLGGAAHGVAQQAATALAALAAAVEQTTAGSLEDVERRLTVLEEKIFAALLTAASDDELVAIRAEADRDLAPFRRNVPAAQIEQLHRRYVHKRLLERSGLPRLSLFYL